MTSPKAPKAFFGPLPLMVSPPWLTTCTPSTLKEISLPYRPRAEDIDVAMEKDGVLTLRLERHAKADAPTPLVEADGHALHAPMFFWLVLLDHVPAAHGMATPAKHHEPAGHGSHCDLRLSPRRRPTVPASHGVGADEPTPHQLCSVHSSHAVAPSSPW